MTDITLFRGPLRLLLDDWDPVVRRYADSVLDGAVVTMVNMGLLNGALHAPGTGFSITPDGGNITPDVITGTPKGADTFALGCYQVAKLFLSPKPSRFSWRTRGVSASTGDFYRYLSELEANIHQLENGEEYFHGYQSYFSWMSGIRGLPLGEVLAQFNLQSPLWSATFTRDGMRVA